jgi:hypothetical protein
MTESGLPVNDDDPWEAGADWWQDGFTDGVDPEHEEQILPLAEEHLPGVRRVASAWLVSSTSRTPTRRSPRFAITYHRTLRDRNQFRRPAR